MCVLQGARAWPSGVSVHSASRYLRAAGSMRRETLMIFVDDDDFFIVLKNMTKQIGSILMLLTRIY